MAFISDEQLRELMLQDAHLTCREFCGKYKIGEHRWVKFRRELAPKIAALQQAALQEVEKIDGKKWIFDKHYTYNSDTDTYITFLNCAPKPIVMDGETHRAMQRAYSNWDGNPASINEICRTFSFPRPWFVEYKTRHGWTHDKEPFTNEEVLKKDTNVLVEEALEMRRNVLFQRYEQEKWKQTKEDADKYRKILHNELVPFNIAIQEWKATKPFALPKPAGEDTYSLVVAASDWQIGLKAIADNLSLGGDWNVEVGKKVIESYLTQIYEDVRRFHVKWDTCHLFNLGDLPHGFYGRTESGTQLIMDVTRKQQYDAIFSLLTFFIEGLYQIFGKVEETGVAGNHEGAFGWYAVSRALQERYRNTKSIRISAHAKQVVHKRVGNTLFILAHGRDPKGMKGQYAVTDGPTRQSQIQQEILYALQDLAKTNPSELEGLVQYVFLQGDKHFMRSLEKGAYVDLQVGSPVLGDDYADAMRLKSRPSQSCFLVSHTSGMRGSLTYFFDTRKGKK